ncbi:radical SAM protein [Dysgonomonas sp. 216]|uniref:radical SAM protein n=1 Tax=Dysgonomonas sp. 216 TaxID=2302934 RepID=UPI0013CF4C0C|nr:radical SAM protein [Dysgonomonas sp. 216]NDW17843.1 radical SAM protein [Dysgonomonas sp. 216]
MNSTFYLPLWFFKAKFLGKKDPLQSVIFISDKCNLACKHCNVYSRQNPNIKTYEQIKEELEYCYKRGSRFVDFEGGEPTIWTDGDYDINSLIALAKHIGFFSTTVTTNAVLPFDKLKADSIWVSLDGLGEYHNRIRGNGVFDKLVKNIETSGHPDLSVNMVVNALNYQSVDETIEFVKDNPFIKSISINFHTPYKGTESLFLNWDIRCQVIDKVIAYKKKKYPIMNSVSGLKLMKHNKFKKQCWVSNFILADGTRLNTCSGENAGICDQCGLCMAGEMHSVMTLKPDTILAGMRLRM